jgi:5-methylcytosine-specific restriction endonuclease McrA
MTHEDALFDPTAYDMRSEALLRRVRNLEQLAAYYRTPHWQRFRWYVLVIHGCRCQRCGQRLPAAQLHVHHLHYRNLYQERLSDVMVLCAACHSRRHHGFRDGTSGPGRRGPGRSRRSGTAA